MKARDERLRWEWPARAIADQLWWEVYPMVRVCVPLVAGMLVGSGAAGRYEAWAPVLFVLLSASVVGMVYFHFAHYGLAVRRFQSVWFGLCAMLFAFVLGCLLFMRRFEMAERGVGEGERVVEGVVCAVPLRKASTWAVELRRSNGSRVLAYLSAPSEGVALPQVGDTVALLAAHWQPTSPRSHARGEEPDELAFYRSHLFYRGVSATCFVPEGEWCLLGAWGGPLLGGWREAAVRARERIAAHYWEGGVDGQAAAVVAAMTIGQRTGLSPALRQDFADAGLSHVLALSGFHLTIVLTILNGLLLRGVLPLAWRRGLVVGVVPVLWGYVLLAGSPASLVRAAVIATVVQLCVCRGRQMGLENALASAACLMLCFDPFALMDVGFQLSFLSMLGIALVAQPLRRHVEPFPRGVGFVVDVLLVTFSATLFTLPLTILHFGRVPLLSMLSNVPASLLALGVMWVSVLWWLSAWLPGGLVLQGALGEALSWLANALAGWVDWVGSLPGGTLSCTLDGAQVAVLYALLLGAVGWVRWRRAWMLEVALAALILFGALRLVS